MMAAPDGDIDRMFQALADPYRRSVIERLARGPASVKQLAAPASIGLPAVLKQLRVLETGGIVVSEKSGRVRTYRIRPQAFRPITGWLEAREREMHLAFDRLSALMAEIPEEHEH